MNIVWGGAAGAVPPLVGWAAATGSLSWTAVYLFAIVFYWTPPHFWALSLLMKSEYEKVGVPMLPVVRGEDHTRRQILLYSILLYAVTQLPFCAGGFGVEYLVASMSLGGAVHLRRRAPVPPRRPPVGAAPLPVLAAVPGAAVRGDGRGQAGRVLGRRARPPVFHRGRRGQRADRVGPDGAARRLRARPAGHRAEGVRGAAGVARAPGRAGCRHAGRGRPGAGVPGQAGGPPLPGRDGRPGARSGRVCPGHLRRRRRPGMDGRHRRRRAAREPGRPARVRRDEGQVARARAGQAVRRGGCTGAGAAPPHPGRRGLRARRWPSTRRRRSSTRRSGPRPGGAAG